MDLFEVSFERDEVVRDVIVGEVEIVADLFTDGHQESLEAGAVRGGAEYPVEKLSHQG